SVATVAVKPWSGASAPIRWANASHDPVFDPYSTYSGIRAPGSSPAAVPVAAGLSPGLLATSVAWVLAVVRDGNGRALRSRARSFSPSGLSVSVSLTLSR